MKKHTLFLLVTLILGAPALSAQEVVEFANKTLFTLHQLSPGACDHPYNMPYFLKFRDFEEKAFSGYLHLDDNGRMDGKFRATRFIPETDYEAKQREQIRLNYTDGQLQGLCTYELSYDFGDESTEVLERIEVWYEDGEPTKVTYTDYAYDRYGDDPQQAVVEEIQPDYLNIDYFRMAVIVLRKNEDGPQLVIAPFEGERY